MVHSDLVRCDDLAASTLILPLCVHYDKAEHVVCIINGIFKQGFACRETGSDVVEGNERGFALAGMSAVFWRLWRVRLAIYHVAGRVGKPFTHILLIGRVDVFLHATIEDTDGFAVFDVLDILL